MFGGNRKEPEGLNLFSLFIAHLARSYLMNSDDEVDTRTYVMPIHSPFEKLKLVKHELTILRMFSNSSILDDDLSNLHDNVFR